MFQMLRPYDLMSLLKQEERVDEFSQVKKHLIAQKEEIESDNCECLFALVIYCNLFFWFVVSDNEDDVEKWVYTTNQDCIKAGVPLIDFDLYVGTLVFAYPKSSLLSGSSASEGSGGSKSASSASRSTFPDSFPANALHQHDSAHQHLSHLTNLPVLDNLLYDGGKSMYTIVCSNTSAKVYHKEASRRSSSENNTTSPPSSPPTETLADKIKYGPNCSDYLELDFSMTTFEHLPVSLRVCVCYSCFIVALSTVYSSSKDDEH